MNPSRNAPAPLLHHKSQYYSINSTNLPGGIRLLGSRIIEKQKPSLRRQPGSLSVFKTERQRKETQLE